jgi:hypothetical protein
MKTFISLILLVAILFVACILSACNAPSISPATGEIPSESTQSASPSMVITSSETASPAASIPTVSSTTISSPTTIPASASISLGNGRFLWKSNLVAANMIFGPGVAATVGGKNYLVLSVNMPGKYLSDGPGTYADAGILILDLSNPENPQEISYLNNGTTTESSSFILNLKRDGLTVYAVTQDRLWMTDISDPYHPRYLGEMKLDQGNWIIDMEIAGNYAYLLVGDMNRNVTLNTLDISDPTQLRSVAKISSRGSAPLRSSGHFLFGLSQSILYIYDISQPSAVKEIGFLENPFPKPIQPAPGGFIPMYFFDMAADGKYVYVAAGVNKLLVVDISNPAIPKVITDFTMREQGTRIVISGKTACMLLSDGPIRFSMGITNLLAFVDTSNPDKLNEYIPTDLNSAKSPSLPDSFRDLIMASQHLYFTRKGGPVIEIVDIK